ncbi:hypothetical protein QYF61_024378 [Mycteria americana]|uniref:Uncharacterized protein n=1 Tax=Mycteria americana TaxID=33587 RepID=A0AAN7NVX5_MYCAM|nr:hypothetical protein QYF61_024378 [Mycteria americana]
MARSRAAYEYTEAEDKSMRLGFLLIAAGLLSLLGLGCCWLRPALQERSGGGSANCTVLAVRQLGERFACTFSCGAACRGTARYPCLQVLVRTSRSSAPALLHEDERQLRTNPKVRPALPKRGAGWCGVPFHCPFCPPLGSASPVTALRRGAGFSVAVGMDEVTQHPSGMPLRCYSGKSIYIVYI